MSNGIAEIENKISGVIAGWNMLPEGCTVVAGLSGGADSTALAHFLLRHAKAYHISLIAAHINHGLRGAESDSDERFVRSWCEKNGVELKVFSENIRDLARKNKQGLEECGRNVRYAFFRRLCGADGRIATAHTLSDSAETVLLNLTKGAGLRGLCGIPPVRGNIVRPLIGITRAEVERYCSHYGLSYVTDRTNFSEDCDRNRIRLTVVPALKSINPLFESAVYGMTRRIREEDAFLTELAQDALDRAQCRGGYRISVLRDLSGPLLGRTVSLAVERAGRARLGSGNIAAVSGIILAGSGSVTVAGGIQCTAQGNTLFIVPPGGRVSWRVPFSPEGTRLPDGRVLTVSLLSRAQWENGIKFNKLFFHNLINYDTIINIISVRNRRAGDFFRPAGRGVTKSLKKLFNEAKIPPLLRDETVLLDGEGTIFWAEGFGASEDARVTEETARIAEVKIMRECSH